MSSDLRSKLFFRGYDHAEAIDFAEQIMLNLNNYAKSAEREERIRKQREHEVEQAKLVLQMKSKPCVSNPDKWFTTLPAGRIKASLRNKLISDAIEARDACLDCPIMVKCGELGMQEENLHYGIWGGMLVAERLEKAGLDRASSRDITERAEWRMKELIDARV